MEPDDYFDGSEPPAEDPPGVGTPVEGDAIDHLWNAAHEMLRAMRTLIDAADEFVEAQRTERPAPRRAGEAREGRVHHIDIDLRSEPDPVADTDANFGTSAGAS